MPRNADVDAWFAESEHPLKDAMLRVREIILEEPRMDESIKWKTPTFSYRGNLASFNPRTKAYVSLLFHSGASIPGVHQRLEGGGDVARYMRLADLDEVEAAADDLRSVVAAWCDRP
jgi:hypothetical protein